jgi:biotin transporter BioY
MIRLLLVLLFTSLLACSAFVAVKVPFLQLGPPRHLPTAETLYHWKGLVFGSHVITAQIPAVWITGALLGPRRGGLAVALYLALGLGGLPIFTNGGGFGYVAQPTFGYLAAFLPAVILVGRTSAAPRFGRTWLGMVQALVVIQGVGLVYELARGGLLLSPSAWGQYGSTQVLQFLPGQLALLTALAFGVSASRKLSAWWEARSEAAHEETLPPLLPPDAYPVAEETGAPEA